MKKITSLRIALCSVAVAATIILCPMSSLAANSHCGASAVQTTGSYIYNGSTAHMYRTKICNYTYKKKVTYKKCMLCGSTWTEFGSQYDEKHSLHK